VEAVGWTLAERTHRWSAAATRAAATVAAGVLLALGAGLIVASAQPWRLGAAVAGLGTVLLLIATAAMSRALGTAAAATVLGTGAVAYAALTGDLAVRAAHGSGELLAAGSAALIALILAVAAAGGGEPAFVTAGLVAVVLLVAGTAGTWTPPAGVAALGVGLVFLLSPMVPGLAYRMARLPAPFLPGSAEELRRAQTTMPATVLSDRSLLADRYITALIAGTGLVLAAAAPVLLGAPGWAPSTVVGLGALLALLRARHFSGRAQRVWYYAAAMAAAAAAVLVTATRLSTPLVRAGLALGVLVVALLVAGVAARTPRPASPPVARLLDVVEVIVAVATVPVILSVMGVYAYVRSMTG
jgi:type VII secretion integral membrane protein EccD